MLGDSGFGRYELVERLAVRAASELFVVKVSGEHGFRRRIVLKRLSDDAFAQQFIDDAKLSAKLSHAKIVQTLELGHVGDAPYVATDYVDGVDLLAVMQELAKQKRTLEVDVAAWIAQELLDALDYAHTFVDDGKPTEIVHGRLSPSKLLLGESGEVKLCDFGVLRRVDLHGGQDYGHMSPEQVMEEPVDARSDVFCTGILLAEMLACRRLFAASNEFDVMLAVRDVRLARLDGSRADADLLAIVKKALEKKPEDRWQTAAAFRDALDEWIFAKRAKDMKQRLAALVVELREAIDRARPTDGTPPPTPAFDDLKEVTGPLPVFAKGSAVERPRAVVAIPEKPAKASSTIPPLPKPEEMLPALKPEERYAARGTVEPHNFEETLAQGTERTATPRGVPMQPPPAERPKYHSDPIPPPRTREPRAAVQPATTPARPSQRAPSPSPASRPTTPSSGTRSLTPASGTRAHPRLLARGDMAKTQGSIGMGLEDLLPARTPTKATVQTTQLLTPEQLAKAGQPAQPMLAKLERAPDDGGDFARTSPLRVLFHLLRSRATGLLSISREHVRKDVYIRDGQLVGVWSNDRNDLFGNYLVAQQVLSEGELAMALATMSHYGGKIGDTLVGLGLLRRVEVFRHLTRHARVKVVEICTWTTGRYAWYAGNEDPREAFPPEGEAFTILGEGALALPAAVIDPWLAKHHGDRLVVVKTQRLSPEVFGVRSALTYAGDIDGVRTLGAIVDRQGDRGNAARLLYLLVACDLIRFG